MKNSGKEKLRSNLYNDLEVITDNRLYIVAMRFDLTKGAGKIMDTIVNDWALTETGEYLPGQEQRQLIAYCKDLMENGKIYPCNVSGSKADKIYQGRYEEICRDKDCLLVLLGGKFVADQRAIFRKDKVKFICQLNLIPIDKSIRNKLS